MAPERDERELREEEEAAAAEAGFPLDEADSTETERDTEGTRHDDE